MEQNEINEVNLKGGETVGNKTLADKVFDFSKTAAKTVIKYKYYIAAAAGGLLVGYKVGFFNGLKSVANLEFINCEDAQETVEDATEEVIEQAVEKVEEVVDLITE